MIEPCLSVTRSTNKSAEGSLILVELKEIDALILSRIPPPWQDLSLGVEE